MGVLTRRAVLRSGAGFVAAGAIARPFIANAAATTATVWWTQGFVPEEDVAFKQLVADYEKASGNKLDYSIIPFAPLRQKEISAITSGVVPDVMEFADLEFLPLQSWQGTLMDVGDIVAEQKSHFNETALVSVNLYDNTIKKRAVYGVPMKTFGTPFHIWASLIEHAGYKTSDLPKTWDAFIDFFKPIQKSSRPKACGTLMRPLLLSARSGSTRSTPSTRL